VGPCIFISLLNKTFFSPNLTDFRHNISRNYHHRNSNCEAFLPLKDTVCDSKDESSESSMFSSLQMLEKYLTHLYPSFEKSDSLPFYKLLNDIRAVTIKQYSHSFANKIVSETMGKFLYHLVRMVNPKRALELGTMTGYSTNWILYGMAEKEYNGMLTKAPIQPYSSSKVLPSPLKFNENHLFDVPLLLTCEINSDCLDIARYYLGSLNLCSVSVKPYHLNYRQLFKLIPARTEFDFIFVDCAKRDYKQVYETVLSKQLLSPSGIMLFDNVLFRGAVAEAHSTRTNLTFVNSENPSYKPFNVTESLYQFNSHVAEDNRTSSTVLPIFDGILLVQLSPLFKK